ncbi:MAG TPA: hypothetical protein VH744_05370, partial [Terriglobales bacterium]
MEKASFIFRLVIFLSFLVLVVFVQRFWFLSAWHRIQDVTRPLARHALQTAWVIALVILLATFLDPFLGRFIPRRGWGSWMIAVTRLWLFASFFAFLAFHLVTALGWSSGLVTRLFPGKVPAFDPARRDFFRQAAYVASSLPFLAASYGFAAGRFRYQIHKVDVPIANLPKALDG